MREPNHPRWIVAGHPSSQPELLPQQLHISAEVWRIEDAHSLPTEVNSIDAFILVISAKSGVSKEMIELWSRISDLQIPRMIIVNGLEFSEVDFDDVVLIANRVLENVITPYLVLHDELGEPTGLISLTDVMIHDYSGETVRLYPADDELISIVSEFRDELVLATTEMDESSYSQGLLVPAIPYIPSKKIGVSEIQQMWGLLTTR